MQVIDTQDGVQITQEMLAWQKFINHFTKDWDTSETATDQYFKANLAFIVGFDMQTHIMYLGCRAVIIGTDDGNLKFTW